MMTIVLENGGEVSQREQFQVRKLLASTLFSAGQSDEARAVIEPGADALTKFAFDGFVGDWDTAEAIYRDVAKTRSQLDDDPGALAAYGDLVWLLEREMTVFRRNALPDRLVDGYTPLTWYQILAGQFDLAIKTARKGLALENTSGEKLGLKINLAHALLLNNEVPEAMTLYDQVKSAIFSQPSSAPPRLGAHEVLDDLDELAKRGMTRPQMDEIRASMRAAIDKPGR